MSLKATESFLSRYQSRANLTEDEILPPLLYRVFQGTLQRQISSFTSLNSKAVYLILLDNESQIVAWVGSLCSDSDRELAFQMAKEIIVRDYGESVPEEIPAVYEDDEVDELFEAVLETLNTTYGAYSSKAAVAERRGHIENATVSVGILQPSLDRPGDFDTQEKSFAHPDSEGTVPRVDFVPIEKDTLAYIVIGHQYDLWIARGVDENVQQEAVAFMEHWIDTNVFNETSVTSKDRYLQHLQVVYQGEERFAFRRPFKIFTDFEPSGQTLSKVASTLLPIPEEEDGSMAANTAANAAGNTAANAITNRPAIPAQKSARLPVTFSEFRLEDDNLAASFMHRYDEEEETAPTNFWNDVQPAQAQKNVLFGEYVPKDEDYAPPTKLRMTMGAKNHLQPEQFEILEHENLGIVDRKDLVMRAKHEPSALLGWQIEIDEGLYSGVYVIIGFRKSKVWRKTSFQAITPDLREIWLRLRRGRGKGGLVFRPLRQVARIDPAPAVEAGMIAAERPTYGGASEVNDLFVRDRDELNKYSSLEVETRHDTAMFA